MTEQLLLHGIAVYNPGILSKEELKRYFVARQPLLKKLLDELKREQPGKTPQHRLIVGTRGMGKTTLLHRFALAVSEDAILSAHWLPLTFPEEQYNIARLSDLWVNCLDALGDSLEASGNSDLLDELDACVDELPSEEDERAKTALQALMDFADRLGRRLLLLIDSLDIVLERLKKSHWEIREVLGHEPRLMLVGASARVLEVTYEYESAFYDFFKIHELKGLGEDEMRDVLCRLAEVDNNTAITRMIEQQPARLRALHTLTGGNPRTAVWLYGVLAQGIEGDVRSDLERLLDQSTPLYKARFEELPAQSQKVVDAMAIHWDPLTARQLAERTRLPVNTVSTQVVRLADQGVVEKVPLRPGKKNGFQIAERFFNIWYLMRASRRVRRRLIWLVQFLKVFYSQDELKVRAHHHLHNGERGGSDDRIRHAEYAFSLASAVDDPIISSALERSALQTMLGDSKLKKELAALLRFDDPDGKLKALADPLEFMQELKDRVIAARTQWPSGIEADAFASALKGSLTLTPEEKRQVIEALPDWENGQIVQFNKRLREEKSYWEARFLGHSALIFVIRRAVVEGHMAKIGDAAGAQVAANLLPSKLLSAYADVARLGADPAFFSLTELHTL
ncbi:AAA family ATPase, partial [Thiolapillus sp.]|uniref:AAA family ATPase n=3 Tax=Thiolapillus sp. TaxID=2017437 RepID=UPI003AF67327